MTVQEIKTKLMSFAAKAVGVPFVDRGRSEQGWDCWGLVVMAYKTCFGIDLPYGTDYTCNKRREAGEALVDGAQEWEEVQLGKERSGDVILMRPCHASLVLEKGKMLSCQEDYGTSIERFDNSVFKHKIIGIYRHADLI